MYLRKSLDLHLSCHVAKFPSLDYCVVKLSSLNCCVVKLLRSDLKLLKKLGQ